MRRPPWSVHRSFWHSKVCALPPCGKDATATALDGMPQCVHRDAISKVVSGIFDRHVLRLQLVVVPIYVGEADETIGLLGVFDEQLRSLFVSRTCVDIER